MQKQLSDPVGTSIARSRENPEHSGLVGTSATAIAANPEDVQVIIAPEEPGKKKKFMFVGKFV